eukprot:1161755-Pelagomonas_calceolata.AAC.11
MSVYECVHVCVCSHAPLNACWPHAPAAQPAWPGSPPASSEPPPPSQPPALHAACTHMQHNRIRVSFCFARCVHIRAAPRMRVSLRCTRCAHTKKVRARELAIVSYKGQRPGSHPAL